MTISIPSPTIYHNSTMPDITFTLDNLVSSCVAVEWIDGLEVRDGTQVFAYQGANFTPPLFEDTNETYEIGDIVIKDCKLHKISDKTGTGTQLIKKPKEPEEYGAWDSGVNFNAWTHRYVRFSNTVLANACLGNLGTYNSRWYYLYNDYGCCGDNCGDYVFAAKDTSVLGCQANCYKSTCLKGKIGYAYGTAFDIPADVSLWACPGYPARDTLNLKSLIIRGNYAYSRTHLSDADAPIQYHVTTIGSTIKYALSEIQSPAELDGFSFKRTIASHAVFDGKNYTVAETYPTDDKVEWEFYNTQTIDSIAFGKVIAESVSVTVTSTEGDNLFTLTKRTIDNNLSNERFQEAVTQIFYFNQKITSESIIKVTFHGSHVSVGDIVVGDSLDMGFTNLEFSNDYKDYSPNEEDQWGNIIYIDGVRVKRWTGTADLPVEDYDLMVRQMEFLGGKEVIINGSDSLNNTPPNSISIFQATMMIARIKSIKLNTRATTNKIEDIANYSFEIRERV